MFVFLLSHSWARANLYPSAKSAANGPRKSLVLALLAADPTIRDTQHKANAFEWAEFFGHKEIVRILAAHEAKGK
jgi:hypothetical protein